MRQQYKRQSFATWAFWLTLLVGGTLYGDSHFDWFDIAWPRLTSGSGPAVAQATTPAGSLRAPASAERADRSHEFDWATVGAASGGGGCPAAHEARNDEVGQGEADGAAG